MTDIDNDFVETGNRLWDLVDLDPDQYPEFGIVVVAYVDHDGRQRFSWRVGSVTDRVDTEPAINLLNQLISSIKDHTEAVPLDPFE